VYGLIHSIYYSTGYSSVMDLQEEALIRLLTDTANRAILTVLANASHGLSVTELSERLVSEDEVNSTRRSSRSITTISPASTKQD